MMRRIRKTRVAQPAWMRELQIGDVLESATGSQRVVRKVYRYDNGDLSSVVFAIRHCSWTRRPYTSLGHTDLRTFGYRPVGVHIALDTPLDAELARLINDHHSRGITCCDVRGIA